MDFDVPRWLASIADCPREAVKLERETRSRGMVNLRYSLPGERTADVSLRTIGGPPRRAGGWEVVAWIGRQVERVEVPPGTRFEWR